MSKIVSATFFVVLVFLIAVFFSFQTPSEWFLGGNAAKSYQMGKDISTKDGSVVYHLKSVDSLITGFGTVMNYMDPTPYLGKRVRMTGMLKTIDVKDWSGFWLRIDEKDTRLPLGFDNMHDGRTDRSIRGTTDWNRYEIILDVPKESFKMAYGGMISGVGQIWFKDIKFEIIDKSIRITGR
jgi:hypothetical protein